MEKRYLIPVIIVVILILIALNPFSSYNFKKYTVNETCRTYYSECTCIGSLSIENSYTEQFVCKGYEFCKDIHETECS